MVQRSVTPAKVRALALVLVAGVSLAACATPKPKLAHKLPGAQPGQPSGAGGAYKVGKPYQIGGIWYVPREQPDYDETGIASWYGQAFHMKSTANGERFDMHAISAAHTTLPLPSIVEVTNLENGRKLQLRVNDRGPFAGGRIIDLSQAAARELGFERQGLAKVRVRYVGPAPLGGPDTGRRYASASSSPTTVRNSDPASPSLPPAPHARAAAPEPQLAAYAPGPAARTAVESAPLAFPEPPPAHDLYGAPQTAVEASAAEPGGYRIQAGAYSDWVNARRAAEQLAHAGEAVIEPVQRPGGQIYRVMLTGPADEGEAWALRDKVAAFGFADARVVRPF